VAEISFQTIEIKKLYPLAISRGTMSSSVNLFVRVKDEGFEGIGELSPATGSNWTAERGQSQLQKFVEENSDLMTGNLSSDSIYAAMRRQNLDPPAIAALDTALWDLRGKQAGMPLYRLLGLSREAAPTSVTIGINPPEVTRERVPEIISRTGARCLKIKLGSPLGLDHDKEHFMAAAESSARFHVKLRIDANGGWTVDSAIAMIDWLSKNGVDYVEQPLPAGSEAELPKIFENRKLPIFLDETIKFSENVIEVADVCDGVNLKLMKCGGITEALRIVATARACGLQTMIGCMSETSVAIAAGASLSALFDYIDLDSQLNLDPDPATGAELVDGKILPNNLPGHGAVLHA
jgi:L-alanine-DL-glutamate epimerase-like enolase superfamily enzyme